MNILEIFGIVMICILASLLLIGLVVFIFISIANSKRVNDLENQVNSINELLYGIQPPTGQNNNSNGKNTDW